MEYDVKGFLEKITPKNPAPQPVPIAVPKSEPPAPIEPKPVAKPDKSNFPQRLSDEQDAQIEFERHPDLFDDTPGGWENVQLVLDFVKVHHDNYLSQASVSDAISTLRRRGELLTLFQPEPAPKTVPAAAPAVQQPQPAVQQAPPPKPVDDLPPLPSYVVRVLGNNPLRTRKDIDAISSSLFSHLYKGPHQKAFKARIDAVGRR